MKEKSNVLLIVATVLCALLFGVSLFSVLRGCSNDTPKAEAASERAVRFTSPPTFIFRPNIQYFSLTVFDSLNPDTPATLDVNILSSADNISPFFGSYSLVDRLIPGDNNYYDIDYFRLEFNSYYFYTSLHNLSTAFNRRVIQGVPQYFVSSVGDYPRPYWFDIDYVPISDTSYPVSLRPSWPSCFRFRWFFSENKSLDSFYLEFLMGYPLSNVPLTYHYSYWLGDGSPDFSNDYFSGFNDGYEKAISDASQGADAALTAARQEGFDAGYAEGLDENFNAISPYYVLGNFMNNFLDIEIVPGISIGWIFTIQFGFILFGLVLKIFLGG